MKKIILNIIKVFSLLFIYRNLVNSFLIMFKIQNSNKKLTNLYDFVKEQQIPIKQEHHSKSKIL